MNIRSLFLLMIVAVTVAASLFLVRPRPKVHTPQTVLAEASPATISVAKAARVDLTDTLTLTAELIPYQEVEVMAKVAGYVQTISVDVGDHVVAGQTLATLEVPEMRDDMIRGSASIDRTRAEVSRAQEELSRAESGYQMAHLTYTRLATVMRQQPGLLAQQEVDDAQTRDHMAAAQVAAAKSAVSSSQEQTKVAVAELNKSKTLMEYTRVTAPFTGVITKRYADKGSMIQAGIASQTQAMPLVRLSEVSRLRLVLPVPESAAGVVRAGTPVNILVRTIDRRITGRVARTSNQLNTESRSLQVQVDIPNANGSLLPGMFAEATIQMASRGQAISVPLAAVKRKQGQASVFVVTAQGKVEERAVETGVETALQVEIKSGLEEGAMVAVANLGELISGQMVKPKLADKESVL